MDQFLKHLLDVGINKIIRIGGRSKAPELEGKNLRVVSRETSKTTVESRILGENYSAQEACLKDAGNQLKVLHQTRKAGLTSNHLMPFLWRHFREIADQFREEDEEGFTVVGGDPIQVWLGKKKWAAGAGDNLDVAALARRAAQNIFALTHLQRWALAESWLARVTQETTETMFEVLEEANRARERIHGVHDDVNRRTLLKAHVVGVTTTGLARNIKTLRNLGSKIVICEEAAEVMEPHLISAFMPGVEHFIQIGDHRQLRPLIQNYLQFSLETATGRAYQLDRSQFERRAVGEPGLPSLPVAQLNVQRRMRPEISQLIRSVYPNLQDHASVNDLPSVVGMAANLFWLDHDHPEDSRDDGARAKSHSNTWEVGMAVALVRHLVRQGEYKSTDIALLTPYTGQLQKLRAALSKDFEIVLNDRDLETLAAEGFTASSLLDTTTPNKPTTKTALLQTLRLATIDNFQGEEAAVTLISLVRSNGPPPKPGFLRTPNRINVLLSRAQHGLYLIGNAATYRGVPLWKEVQDQFIARGAFGRAVPLCCPRHVDDEPMLCAEPQDFERKSPEGGCGRVCERRLEPCGHSCPARCHARGLHEAFVCMRPCPRVRAGCDHACVRLCGEACGLCQVKVNGVVIPSCGHVHDKVACWRTGELEKFKCDREVERVVLGCGHKVVVQCWVEVEAKGFSCPAKCEGMLGCGHPCPGKCGQCRKKGNDGVVVYQHQKCTKVCGRPHGTCNHRCSRRCHDGEGCGTCTKVCEVSRVSAMLLPFGHILLTLETLGSMFPLSLQPELPEALRSLHREMHLGLQTQGRLLLALRRSL